MPNCLSDQCATVRLIAAWSTADLSSTTTACAEPLLGLMTKLSGSASKSISSAVRYTPSSGISMSARPLDATKSRTFTLSARRVHSEVSEKNSMCMIFSFKSRGLRMSGQRRQSAKCSSLAVAIGVGSPLPARICTLRLKAFKKKFMLQR